MPPVSLNGKIVDSDKALIGAFDRGFLYGDGLFETIRISQGRPLLFDEHLDRLCDGLAFLRIQLPMGRQGLRAAAEELLERLGHHRARMRITVSRGQMEAQGAVGSLSDPHVATALISTQELPRQTVPRSLRCIVADEYRRDGASPLAARKSLNYLSSLLAREKALEGGAEEAIVTDMRGFLSEAATANLFWLSDGRLFTPSDSCGALRGVTAKFLKDIAAKLGRNAQPAEVLPEELGAETFPFLTNSIMGIARVTQLGGQEFRPSPDAKKAFDEILSAFLEAYPIAD